MHSEPRRELVEQQILDDLAYHLTRSMQEDDASGRAMSAAAAACHAKLGAMHGVEASELLITLDGMR